MLPRGERELGIALYEKSISGSTKQDGFRFVGRIWGSPLLIMTNVLLSHIKKNGYRATALSSKRKAPIDLDEQSGVSIGLLMLSLKPLRKIRRMEIIVSKIASMEPEEAYYWYSKCTESDEGRRAQRALRILLSEE